MPLSGTVCCPSAGTSYRQPSYTPNMKSMFTHYEDMKGDENAKNGVIWGLGVTQGHRKHSHSIEHIRLPIRLYI